MAYSIQLPLTAFPHPLFMAFKKTAKNDDDELKEEESEEGDGEAEGEEGEEVEEGLDFTDSTDGEKAFDDEVTWQEGDHEKENDELEGML